MIATLSPYSTQSIGAVLVSSLHAIQQGLPSWNVQVNIFQRYHYQSLHYIGAPLDTNLNLYC